MLGKVGKLRLKLSKLMGEYPFNLVLLSTQGFDKVVYIYVLSL